MITRSQKTIRRNDRIPGWNPAIQSNDSRIFSLEQENLTLRQEITALKQSLSETRDKLRNLKRPEIGIDFSEQILYHRDGLPFEFSSSARHYRNDVFRLLTYLFLSKRRRFHVLEAGLIFPNEFGKKDMNWFRNASRFAMAKSGLNATFVKNCGMELLQADETVLPVILKRDADKLDVVPVLDDRSALSGPSVSVVHLPAGKAFDYFSINPNIRLKNAADNSDPLKNEQEIVLDDEMLIQKMKQELPRLHRMVYTKNLSKKEIRDLDAQGKKTLAGFSMNLDWNEIHTQAFRQVLEYEQKRIQTLWQSTDHVQPSTERGPLQEAAAFLQ